MTDFRYTLVQHSGWTIGRKPAFKHAVELTAVHEKQANKIRNKGGLVFDTYVEGRNAEKAHNYPPEHQGGIVPHVLGKFIKVNDELVFIPEKRTTQNV